MGHYKEWWHQLRRACLTLVLCLCVALCYADAPAPTPKPKPRPSPIVEPIDIVPTDPPEPLPEDTPLPSPSPVVTTIVVEKPSVLVKQNARGFHVDTYLGALVTMTGDVGTKATPTFQVNANGPLAIGDGRSLGRLGTRLGLSTDPGETFTATDLATYKSASAGFWYGVVVGHLRDVDTTVIIEGDFSSRLKGSADLEPRSRLVRSASLGVKFDARKSNASGTFLLGWDEASATCPDQISCQGFHSGLSLMIYGQLPISSGVLFIGDATLSVSSSLAGVIERHDILRVGIVVDPVEAVKAMKR